MTDVIDLKQRILERGHHRAGPARCLNCKHEWEAVAPIGVCDMECPSCGTHQGVFKGVSNTEFAQLQCNCGEFTFFIDEHSAYCAHCGNRPEGIGWQK